MSVQTRQVGLLLLGLALLAGAIWLLVVLQPLLVALTIAALLAYLLNPAVVWLTARLNGKRPLAAALLFALVLAILAGLLTSLGAVVWDQWPQLRGELNEALVVMEGWLRRPFQLFGFEVYPEALLENLRTAGGNALSTLTIGADGLVSGVTDNLLWGLVVLVSFYYLLKDGHRIVPEIIALTPAAQRDGAKQLFDEIDTVWGIFLRVQLFIFAVLAVLVVSSTGLIIWLFRQGWLPLSPIGLALLLVGVYAAIQQVDNLWLRPQLMGNALKLHPGVIFVGLIAGLALSGLLGALLIVPVLATVKVIGRFAYVRLVKRADGLPAAAAHPPEDGQGERRLEKVHTAAAGEKGEEDEAGADDRHDAHDGMQAVVDDG